MTDDLKEQIMLDLLEAIHTQVNYYHKQRCGGSMIECLTPDLVVAGSSLTRGTGLCL